jgi:hypothetical protein
MQCLARGHAVPLALAVRLSLEFLDARSPPVVGHVGLRGSNGNSVK